MSNLHNSPVVRIQEHKVSKSDNVSIMSIFLSHTTYMFDTNSYVPIVKPYSSKWSCREVMRRDTLGHIPRYIHHIQPENHLIVFNMAHMIDNIQDLVDVVNDITIRFKKTFVIISSEYGYDPKVLSGIKLKKCVALAVPNNVRNIHSNTKHFSSQIKKEGFICENKAKHMIAGNVLFKHAPEIHYEDGYKNHVHEDAMKSIDTTGMVCTSGVYINPDGDVSLCPNDTNGANRSYIYDNINNPDYERMPVVNMCCGKGCPGSINKHVRTVMQFAGE